jgi:hypothetical protein
MSTKKRQILGDVGKSIEIDDSGVGAGAGDLHVNDECNAVKRTLEPIYESVFEDSSYGYRPGRSQHQPQETGEQFTGVHGLGEKGTLRDAQW